MTSLFECPGGTKAANPYSVGTLLWIERNRFFEVRALLADLVDGAISAEEAAADLWALETDTLWAHVPPGRSLADAADAAAKS